MLASDKVAENIFEVALLEVLQREIIVNGFGKGYFVNIAYVAIP
jgi:hypothetical protein